MSDKWTGEDLKIGSVWDTTFYPNGVAESGFRFRATHLGGKRAPKVVLCDDPRIRPGIPCRVRITTIRKPQRSDRGAIEVEFPQAKRARVAQLRTWAAALGLAVTGGSEVPDVAA